MKSVEAVLKEVFQNPTAPYRENWVLDYVHTELKHMKVPFFYDRWGNIIAGSSNSRALKNSERVALMAHTDHPGFHVLGPPRKGIVKARWLGGCPPKIRGAKIAIHIPAVPRKIIKGKIISAKLTGKKRLFDIKLASLKGSEDIDHHCFGAFDFSAFTRRGYKIFTRAADDLAGVTIILTTLARLKPNERKNMLGIFTRAEEVGFRGALGIIYDQAIGKKNTAISLEASRQLPGARLGKGPVIRLGDKRTLFDSYSISRLDQAGAVLGKKIKNFKVQRRIMNGGTCEATPFNLHGISTSGLAVPLGNYHNERRNGTPGAEFIDLRDVHGAVKLCVEFYKQMSRNGNPLGGFVKDLAQGFKSDSHFLKARIPFAKLSSEEG